VAAHKKSARRRRAWIVFADESGVSLLPAVRSTWAPKGQTPVIRHRFSWSKMSMAAALAYKWDASEAALVFALQDEAYDTDTLIEFLEEFHEHFKRDQVTLIWDRLPAHHSTEMLHWIADQRDWLVVEELPAYGHDLNPCELLWGNVKGIELANLCPQTIEEAHAAAMAGLERAGVNTQLCFNFLDHTGLSL
jgi:transposase